MTPDKPNPANPADFFGPPIYSYTRAEAIEDGVLVDVSDVAAETGIRFPVALTRAVYEDCVAWDEADGDRKGVYQDEAGRLWDVVHMLRVAINRGRAGSTVHYQLYRVPRDRSRRIAPVPVTLKAVVGPGDAGEPVITIMQPEED